ncbi:MULTISPECIES: CoA transferase [unclassified Nocardioides]|uniref:CaiB/BaiF CoA transferase family protein n=1 Tax=unclassified Nocardioides TaxID=2615069 RepID=UPI0000570D40|nr:MULTISPECIES: CoA transferase [unclassified Nocardioides]ABL81667.1 Formyl-CoA transferase [Nocardioides sp. JS614]
MTTLQGITVLEVGGFLAAPWATMHLADLGARVIKVEMAGQGDSVRQTAPIVNGESAAFATINRNKESVVLDLKSPDGMSAFLELVRNTDVLVENLRPGAMSKLGLGYSDLAPRAPSLIYASASGWGQDGPDAGLPGLDIMAQARSGLMSLTGSMGGPAVKVGVPVCDLVCALYVALAVTAALHERQRSGLGQFIDVSLLESAVSLAVWEAPRYFVNGEVGAPLGTAHQSLAPYQAFGTSDGKVTLGAVTTKTWSALCEVLGLPELERDPRFVDGGTRFRHRAELAEVLEGATRAFSTSELLDKLIRAQVPCARIADIEQALTDPHLAEREFFWDSSHPTIGTVRQTRSPMRFSRTPTVAGQAGPLLGQHTQQVLAEFGAGEA